MNRRLFALQLAVLVVATGLSISAIPFAPQIHAYTGPAYVALLILSISSGALFMVPGFGWAGIAAFAVALGNPWGPALVGTTGQAIGELVAYLLGATASPWIRGQRHYARIEPWVRRRGLLAIFVIAATPNPVFDLAGAIAGAARLGWWRFFLASWAGRLIKNIGFALLGTQAAGWLQSMFQ